MAGAPIYFATVENFHATFTTGVTATDGSGSLTAPTWWGTNTPPANDWMLVKLIIVADSATGVGNLADSLLTVFARDPGTGNAVRKIRTIDLGDPAAGSTTTPEYWREEDFGPAYMFQKDVDLRFGISVTPTAGNITIVGIAQSA